MKKLDVTKIVVVVLVMLLMAIGGSAIVNYRHYVSDIELYQEEIDTLEAKLDDAYADKEEIEAEYDELSEQIWNKFNDSSYDITVEHDGAIYNYSYDSDEDNLFGLVRNYHNSICY